MTVSSPQIQQSNVGIIDTELLHRAVTALLKHHESHTDEKRSLLLGNEERIALHFGLAKVPSNPSSKPVRIEIPHPLHRFKTTTAASTNTSDHGTGIDSSISEQGLEEADVCIIVKESAKPTVQELIERFPTRMGCVKKVLGLDSLRKKFSSYEQRRELLRRYDIFLADDRILPMLGKALGKNFFAAKKQPIPLNIVRQKALPLAVQRSIESTYMFMPTGNCLGVR